MHVPPTLMGKRAINGHHAYPSTAPFIRVLHINILRAAVVVCVTLARARASPPCRVYAELAVHYILRVASSLLSRPLNERQERELAVEELPPPMLPGDLLCHGTCLAIT